MWEERRRGCSAPYLRPPKKSERALACVPLYHLYGATTAFLALVCGATVVTSRAAESGDVCLAIAEFKIHCIYLTPYNILTLVDESMVDEVDLSSIQVPSSLLPFPMLTMEEMRLRR